MIRGLDVFFTNGKYPINRGFTFKAYLPNKSDKEHYCIIINQKVIKNKNIYYFYMTSQKNTLQIMKYDKKALISINKNDYSPLTKQTYIQCDKSHLHTIEYKTFIAGFASGSFQKVDNVDKHIIEKILKAINDSKTYLYEEKTALVSY